jgi:pyruvate dehydrogenase E2 component (dihydrolipoamide acetyltransferase)
MRREIEMPRLSDSVEEGVLVTWLVGPGAPVKEGDLVAEIQVEKSSSEVLAPASGRVAELLFGAGDVVRQGAVIAVLETAESSGVGEGAAPAGPAQAAPSPLPTAGAAASVVPGAPLTPAGAREIIASPAAKRLARELGVDLATVAGSGPAGRIVEADVQAAAESGGAASAGVAALAAVEPLSPMRRTIADRLRAGLAETAQLTLTAEADVTELDGRLRGWTAAWGRRASYTEAIVRACALALRQHPRIAARLTDRGLERPERIDIGVAVALEDGLIVPAVRDADRKDVAALGREIADLADRARAGTLAPADTQGACFSVTNLGAYRVDAFTPLLDPPQTAILGVGRARPRPAVVAGAVVPRTLVVLSLTFDHRVVDGAPAAAFLQAVVDRLEAPDSL